MILLIDIGNTNITLGCMDGEQLLFKERIFTDLKMTAVECAISFMSLLELHDVQASEMEGGIISSTVPVLTSIVKEAAKKLIGRRILEVGPGVKTGLDIKIDDPAQLGADLVTGAVAGIQKYGAPLIIVDLGTATAVTVINTKGQVVGGMIMPGVGISIEALSQRTSYLPKINIEPPKKLIGSNTIDCMKSGAVYGAASAIDGLTARIREEIGADAPVIATGRQAKKIVPYCKEKVILDDGLLMNGLKLIYDRNTRKR
ncbi:MAG: type III pantothenate kinase [Eubacteriales bacterium]|nr:type III pantothenate kinase [Eubacteriales bacterium]